MPDLNHRLERYLQVDYEPPRPGVEGQVTRLIGLTLEAVGLKVALGDYCMVDLQGDGSVEAEVVGFAGDRIYLMPLDSVDGLAPVQRFVRV